MSDVDDVGRLNTMPGEGRTHRHGFRVPDALYDAARAAAKERGDHLSDVVRRALVDYVKQTRIGG